MIRRRSTSDGAIVRLEGLTQVGGIDAELLRQAFDRIVARIARRRCRVSKDWARESPVTSKTANSSMRPKTSPSKINVAPVGSSVRASSLATATSPRPSSTKRWPLRSTNNAFIDERIQARIGPEAIVGERFARDQVAVEIFQVDRLGAGFQRHAQAVAGVLLGAAQFAAVGVGRRYVA